MLGEKHTRDERLQDWSDNLRFVTFRGKQWWEGRTFSVEQLGYACVSFSTNDISDDYAVYIHMHSHTHLYVHTEVRTRHPPAKQPQDLVNIIELKFITNFPSS